RRRAGAVPPRRPPAGARRWPRRVGPGLRPGRQAGGQRLAGPGTPRLNRPGRDPLRRPAALLLGPAAGPRPARSPGRPPPLAPPPAAAGGRQAGRVLPGVRRVAPRHPRAAVLDLRPPVQRLQPDDRRGRRVPVDARGTMTLTLATRQPTPEATVPIPA